MYRGSKLLPRESPSIAEHNESRHEPNGPPKDLKVVGGNREGHSCRQVWRRKESQIPAPPGSMPLAQVGERSSPTPAARLTDSSELQISANAQTHTPTHKMEDSTEEEVNPTTDHRKVVVSIPAALLANLRSQCDSKASVSLVGRIQGKHPGLKALTAWARETLHPSLDLLSLQANNVFEVTFRQPEGRIHALNQTDLMCETAAIFFSSWRPHFDASLPHALDRLDHPVWMQIVNLCQVLRDDTFLHTIGEQIGQVISIDNTDAYRAKLFGPRIRLLVRDLDSLPHTVVLPRLDGEGTIDYALEFSGLPNQCGRCRSREHQVRYCPKRELASRHKSSQRATYQRRGQPHRSIHSSPTRILEPPPQTAPTQPETSPEDKRHQTDLQTPDQTISTSEIETQPPANTEENTTVEEPQPEHSMASQEITIDAAPSLQPDEVNFPKLPTSSRKPECNESQQENNQNSPTPTQFVWRSKPILREIASPTTSTQESPREEGSKGKGKQVSWPPDSAPITRQGYRSGRLADDFWAVLNIPNTPLSQRKTLRAIPILLRDRKDETMEFLMRTKQVASRSIALIHIAEQLAGIPWTETRARQHIVNEVAQALYKVLVFTNPSSNPLQRWKQGKWFANWEGELDGDFTCTLYVTVLVQENKIKPRKGHTYSWSRLPGDISKRVQLHNSPSIEAIQEDRADWYELTHNSELPTHNTTSVDAATHPNRFSVLREEDPLTT